MVCERHVRLRRRQLPGLDHLGGKPFWEEAVGFGHESGAQGCQDKHPELLSL